MIHFTKSRVIKLIVLCTSILLIISLFNKNFIINVTNSLDGHVYYKKNLTTIKPNMYVSACPKDQFIKIGLIIKALHKTQFFSACNLNSIPVLKIVAAVPGDHVFADGINDIQINGKAFKGSKPRADFVLPKFIYSGTLQSDEYLLLTHFSNGYDGRYWGIVDRQHLLNEIIEVF